MSRVPFHLPFRITRSSVPEGRTGPLVSPQGPQPPTAARKVTQQRGSPSAACVSADETREGTGA